MDHIEVDGRRIAFRRAGDGPPLLLLHGAVCDSRVWRSQLESFADSFTVIAWDAPGCGGSDDVPADYTMVDYARCLAGFVDALEIERADVIGHSWGSTLALQLCLERPAMVRSVVLVGGYAGWAGSLPPNEVEARLAFALQAADRGPAAFDPHSMRGLFSDAMSAEAAAELALVMREIRPGATRTMARALAACDLRAVLGQIAAPTLVLAGDADERSPLPVARELQRLIAGSTLTVLPGLGHECSLESPVAFETAVRAFLAPRA
jgi:pimeloyl-ACP methyl ester carboxylesterase